MKDDRYRRALVPVKNDRYRKALVSVQTNRYEDDMVERDIGNHYTEINRSVYEHLYLNKKPLECVLIIAQLF